MRDENNGVFLHCFGKHVVGYFEITAWWYHSYSLRTLYVIDWTSFWHLLQAQKIQYNNKSALIYNFIIEMIFHPSWWSFPKREKVIEIGYSLWLQQKLYRVYSRLFRLVGWWQSSLGIKKKERAQQGVTGTRWMCFEANRTSNTIQFVYMNYTSSLHSVIKATGALEQKFWTQISRKGTEENTSNELKMWNSKTSCSKLQAKLSRSGWLSQATSVDLLRCTEMLCKV